jgi:hypothetical protein
MVGILGRLRLHLVIQKDFSSSEAFMEELGWWISGRYLFLPTTKPASLGKEVEFSFTLRGKREILKGRGVVRFISDGTSHLPSGFGMEITSLTPRSETNLKLIQHWQEEHPSPPQGSLIQLLPALPFLAEKQSLPEG